MEVATADGGSVVIALGLEEGNALASAIIEHAEAMPTAALDLANIVREAVYAAHNDFAQPPEALDPPR